MLNKIHLVILIYFLSCCIPAGAQSDTVQKIGKHRTNALQQQDKPYVILISADGFRADFAKRYQAQHLLQLSQRGVSAEYMLSCYPSSTFPNHYSLVTGLYPAHHGLVDNAFYDARKKTFYNKRKAVAGDSSWYGGTPLWVLAEQQKMLTASFYWVGSEAAIQGVRPTYYYNYNENIPLARRLQIVKKWLQLPAADRPHLITFYFPEVDHAGHEFGPEAMETLKSVQVVDDAVGKLVAMTDSLHLPVNFIFVSDHGMANVDTAHPITLPAPDTATWIVSAGPTLVHVYIKNKENISRVFQKLKEEARDYDVYLAGNVQEGWHYAAKDDRHQMIGDILLTSHFPGLFKLNNRPIKPGNHGFDPSLPSMRATFYAWGPQLKNSVTLPPFENINVFPLIAHLLGLSYAQAIDGDKRLVKVIK